MKQALILGSARSGNAVCELLLTKGYKCIIADEKKVLDASLLQQKGVMVFEGLFNDILLNQHYDLVVKNPGLPHNHPFIIKLETFGYFIYTEIEVASWYAPKFKYAAITGTNGKTTSIELLQTILKCEDDNHCAAGNVGIPLSEVVLNQAAQQRKIALEIAAFQLLGIKTLRPVVSAILNLAPDHLDVFERVEDYYRAKALVCQNQEDNDWFLLNLDDMLIKKYVHPKCRVITYSLDKKADLSIKNNQVFLFNTLLFEIKDLKIKGLHNVSNAMVSAACAYKLGVSLENIRKGIQSFRGVEHRIEFVRLVNDIEYYNDSKATTAESTKVALNAFDKPVIVLVGGYDKKTGFDILKEDLQKVKNVIAFGATKEQFKALYPATILCLDMKEAFDKANECAQKGDIILLSPACASYDQFNNFEQRGKMFKEFVNQL